jgi:hypothetical protein
LIASEVDEIKKDDTQIIQQYRSKLEKLLIKLEMINYKAQKIEGEKYFGKMNELYQSTLPGINFSAFMESISIGEEILAGYEVTNNEKETITFLSKDSYLFPSCDIIEYPEPGVRACLIDEEGNNLDSVSIAPGETKWLWFTFNNQLVSLTYTYLNNYIHHSELAFYITMKDKDYLYSFYDNIICNYAGSEKKHQENLKALETNQTSSNE